MGVGVRRVGVVQVVGGHHRQAEVSRQPLQVGQHPGFDAEPVVHHLDVEVALAEDVLELAGHLAGPRVVADPQPGLDLTGRATSRSDQAGCILRQQFPVRAGLVEEAFQGRPGSQPEQVVHAVAGGGQQRHVGEGTAAGDVVLTAGRPAHPLALVAGGVRGEIGLHADDGLHTGSGRLPVKVVGAEDVAVIGHCEGRHAHLGGALEQLGQPGRAVQHRVFGVHVQVDEAVGQCHTGNLTVGIRQSGPTAGHPDTARRT